MPEVKLQTLYKEKESNLKLLQQELMKKISQSKEDKPIELEEKLNELLKSKNLSTEQLLKLKTLYEDMESKFKIYKQKLLEKIPESNKENTFNEDTSNEDTSKELLEKIKELELTIKEKDNEKSKLENNRNQKGKKIKELEEQKIKDNEVLSKLTQNLENAKQRIDNLNKSIVDEKEKIEKVIKIAEQLNLKRIKEFLSNLVSIIEKLKNIAKIRTNIDFHEKIKEILQKIKSSNGTNASSIEEELKSLEEKNPDFANKFRTIIDNLTDMFNKIGKEIEDIEDIQNNTSKEIKS